MGFWLMPQPEAYLRCTVSLPRYADLGPMVDTLNYLENSRITSGFPDIASPLNGYPPIGQIQLWNERGPPPMSDEHKKLLGGVTLGYSSELEAYGLESGIAYWELWLSFHGPMEVVEAQWKSAQRHFAKIPGAKFRVVDRVSLPIDPGKAEDYTSRNSAFHRFASSRSARARPGIPRHPRGICGSHPSFPAPARPSSRRIGCSAPRPATWTCRCSAHSPCLPASGRGHSFSFWRLR